MAKKTPAKSNGLKVAKRKTSSKVTKKCDLAAKKNSRRISISSGLSKIQLTSSKKESFDENSIKWKEIAILGEKVTTIKELKNGGWKFRLDESIQKIKVENPNCDIYLFGGSPQPYSNMSMIAQSCPNIVAIVIQSGYEPPPFVSLQDFQHGTEEIKHMRSQRLTWDQVLQRGSADDGKVFVLKHRIRGVVANKKTEEELRKLEYLTLFTMKPAKEWERKDNGILKVPFAKFSYDIGGGDIVNEEFDVSMGHRLSTFIPDFCDRYDLDEGPHYKQVEGAIREAFEKERAGKEKLIKMLAGCPASVLDNVKTMKIFPQDDRVENKMKYINKYYGHADSIM